MKNKLVSLRNRASSIPCEHAISPVSPCANVMPSILTRNFRLFGNYEIIGKMGCKRFIIISLLILRIDVMLPESKLESSLAFVLCSHDQNTVHRCPGGCISDEHGTSVQVGQCSQKRCLKKVTFYTLSSRKLLCSTF